MASLKARQVLAPATSPPQRLGDLFLRAFGPARGADLELPPREPHGPVDLEP